MNETLAQALQLIETPYHHILEFGVFEGKSLLQIRRTLSNEYEIHGFDSFEGLPEDWVGTGLLKGQFSLDGEIPDVLKNMDNTKLYKGWFADTIPDYLKVAAEIAFIHIDADLYSSSKDILYSDIRHYIKPGTIILFDEWYYNFNPTPENAQHEQKLFYEWASDFNVEYIKYPQISVERQIIKITNII